LWSSADAADRLGDLVSDPHHRVSEVIGSWKIIEMRSAADRAHLAFVKAEKIGAFEHDSAADNLACVGSAPGA